MRISKRSGATIPWPEILKTRRATRPPTPGVKDTPADAVRAISYVPPSNIAAYLARGGALWQRTKLARAVLDDTKFDRKAIANARLRRKDRNRLRARVGDAVERELLSRATAAEVAKLTRSLKAGDVKAASAGDAQMR